MFAITGFYPGSIEYDFAMWLGANPQVRISLILLIPAVAYIAWRRA